MNLLCLFYFPDLIWCWPRVFAQVAKKKGFVCFVLSIQYLGLVGRGKDFREDLCIINEHKTAFQYFSLSWNAGGNEWGKLHCVTWYAMWWVALCPPPPKDTYVQVRIPGTCECDLHYKQSFQTWCSLGELILDCSGSLWENGGRCGCGNTEEGCVTIKSEIRVTELQGKEQQALLATIRS